MKFEINKLLFSQVLNQLLESNCHYRINLFFSTDGSCVLYGINNICELRLCHGLHRSKLKQSYFADHTLSLNHSMQNCLASYSFYLFLIFFYHVNCHCCIQPQNVSRVGLEVASEWAAPLSGDMSLLQQTQDWHFMRYGLLEPQPSF